MRYTYDDIIINPHDPRLRNAIGKEVFFHDNPSELLAQANINNYFAQGVFNKVIHDDNIYIYPFSVKYNFDDDPETHYIKVACIIIKEKDKTTLDKMIEQMESCRHCLSKIKIDVSPRMPYRTGEIEKASKEIMSALIFINSQLKKLKDATGSFYEELLIMDIQEKMGEVGDIVFKLSRTRTKEDG